MMVWLGSVESYYMEDLLTALAMVLGGGAMFGSGLSMDRQLKRHAKYLSVMGDREAVAVEELAREGYDPRYGARPLRRKLREAVEDAAAEQLLDGRLKRGDTARVVAGDRTVRVEREAPAAT